MKCFSRFIFVIILLLVLLGCQSEIQKKEAYFQKAEQYFENNEHKKAEIELKNILQIDPNSIPAYHLLAKNMLKTGNVNSAAVMYNVLPAN